jgi:ribosomal protein S18 acetylase RimI-like enzyme
MFTNQIQLMMHNKLHETNEITNATVDDLQFIYWLFEQAIAFQREHGYIGWQNFDRDFIRADIEKGLLFKIVNQGNIGCIFSICFSDPLIWREKERGDAIYLHRIVVSPLQRGKNTFRQVLDWAILLAAERKLKYIRMDTWSDNAKIISYYKNFGFGFVENYTTPDTAVLPLQHRNLKVALLEYRVT